MRPRLLALVVGLQAAWVLGTVAVQEVRLTTAPTILLETAPVDPRDVLRGDYITLGYRISQLPEALFKPLPLKPVREGDSVYVLLEQRGRFWEPVVASLDPLVPVQAQRLLKGRLRRVAPSALQFPLRVEYGIERYFVPEGRGNPSGKLTVEVAVDRSGSASIKEVYVGDRRFKAASGGRP